MAETVTRPQQTDIPVLHDVDVLVMGGGPGGLGASVAAARQGAKVLLCEQYGFLGGMASAGLVSPFMASGLDGKPFDTGVCQDWRDLMVQMGGMREGGSVLCHETAKLAAEKLCRDAGVNILYHVVLDRPLMDGRDVDCVLLLGKSGITAHRARLYIDCTGDADLAARAGCRFEIGRDEDGGTQPMTTCFDVAGVDKDRMPDRATINAAYDRARAEGRIHCDRENVLFFPSIEPDRVHFNTTRIIGRDATDTLSLSEAELEGHGQVMEFMEFLRRDLAGFENARLHAVADNVGVRESRRVIGHKYLTRKDFERAAKFPDGICRVNYPIDIHSPTGSGTEITRLPKGEWYEIPYGCLVPADCDNMLVGGRPISVDHAVHSSMRVMPPACTIGQACGTAAAMALRDGVTPAEVDGTAVRRSLVEQGVWLED